MLTNRQDNKKTTLMDRRRPKSLDAPVVNQMKRLEAWAYKRADQWKKAYRYTLIDEFRRHITIAKNSVIVAFELPNRCKDKKSVLYAEALGALSIVESNMDIMISDDFCIMSEKEWAECAKMIDDIRVALTRLINSLSCKKDGGSEPPILGAEGVTAGYKDA